MTTPSARSRVFWTVTSPSARVTAMAPSVTDPAMSRAVVTVMVLLGLSVTDVSEATTVTPSASVRVMVTFSVTTAFQFVGAVTSVPVVTVSMFSTALTVRLAPAYMVTVAPLDTAATDVVPTVMVPWLDTLPLRVPVTFRVPVTSASPMTSMVPAMARVPAMDICPDFSMTIPPSLAMVRV